MPIEPNDRTFRIVPIPAIHKTPAVAAAAAASPLGPLTELAGVWKGTGFNQIFRPHFGGGSDFFLELNLTLETLEFTEIPGEIPNRGLLQSDISLFGLTYLQQVADANVKGSDGNPAGIHIEPGIWVNIPTTTNPADPTTVARLASIPHGTTILAQGTPFVFAGPPVFSPSNITPFKIGDPTAFVPFPEQTLTNPSAFRSPPSDIVGVTQAMLNDPNSVLAAALVGKTVTSTTVLQISTALRTPPAPTSGGGTANIAFLVGDAGGPNANAVQMEATFWINQFKDNATGATGLMLQYTQRVLLNFNGLSWPHVSVASLIKQPTKPVKETKEVKEKEIKEHKPEIKEHKPEIKEHKPEIKEHKPEIKEHKLELKEHKPELPESVVVPQIPGPGPGPLAKAGPAAPLPTGAPFIQPEERPAVGDAPPGNDPNRNT
jgi:hypothetical protein